MVLPLVGVEAASAGHLPLPAFGQDVDLLAPAGSSA